MTGGGLDTRTLADAVLFGAVLGSRVVEATAAELTISVLLDVGQTTVTVRLNCAEAPGGEQRGCAIHLSYAARRRRGTRPSCRSRQRLEQSPRRDRVGQRHVVGREVVIGREKSLQIIILVIPDSDRVERSPRSRRCRKRRRRSSRDRRRGCSGSMTAQ